MKTLFIIFFSIVVLGCASDGQLLNTTAGQVAEGNTFSFRDTIVKVNPEIMRLIDDCSAVLFKRIGISAI